MIAPIFRWHLLSADPGAQIAGRAQGLAIGRGHVSEYEALDY